MWINYMSAGILVVLLIWSVYYLLVKRSRKATIPGSDPVNDKEGNFPDILKAGSLYEFLQDLHRKHGPIASFWLGSRFTVSIASPQLFKQHSKPFDRPADFFSFAFPLIGCDSIQTSNGAEGRRRHTAYSKCFNTEATKSYLEIFREESKAFVERWNQRLGEPIAVRKSCADFATKCILRSSLGDYFIDDNKSTRFGKAFDYVWSQMENGFKSSLEFGDADEEKFQHERGIVYDTVKECINKRRLKSPLTGEYLAADAIIELDMSEASTIGDMIALLAGGFHTTTLLLTWALYYIARDDDVQKKLYEEILNELGDHDVDEDNISKLVYMQQVLDETLRCSVLASMTARVQDVDAQLGGHNIPAGTPVMHATGVVGQDPTLYPDPERFDPDRFSPENVKKRPRFSFEPFGFAGKRKCLGYRFALREAKVFLTEIVRNFTVSVFEDQVVQPTYGFITQPSEEIWLNVMKRK